jgi:hypothetical protein
MKKIIYTLVIVLITLYNVNAQSPNLGSASGFALFTAIGAFTNVGDTTYTSGDVGTNMGAFVGFPQGTLVGQIYVADSVSAIAATDVETAYSYLSGLTCDSVIGTILGNGQSLTSNVYCLGAASTLNGSLTLDGQGDPDALFIFKIDGALSTSAFSNIILINSASLNNIYWQINGAFESGDSSVFKGTIITNGAISLLQGSSLFGRGLSRAGAISLHNNLVNIGILPGYQLPIELLKFVAFQKGANVQLNWSTASEINNNYFTIEKSTDAINFETVVNVNGAGNSNTLLNYSSEDNEPFSGTSYYRLMQTDFDGKYAYSNLIKVDFVGLTEDGINIYPNPFTANITIAITDVSQINNYQLMIFNIYGEEVVNTIITDRSTNIETSNLHAGIYSYKVIGENKIIQSGKLISQQ